MARVCAPVHEPKVLLWPHIPVSNQDHNSAAVVIVGAGFAGICQAINLLNQGVRNFIILERSGGFGGTWRDNIFPGAACDVWSHLYSFSFEQSTDWTRAFPGQEEILEYLIGVASKYQLYKYARFNTEVVAARWNEKQMKWQTTVHVKGGQDAEYSPEYTIASDFLVSAVGQLSKPKFPNIHGLSEFQGKLIHTARWDWNYDLKGKRVAIIGAGATAAQVVPEVAKVAGHLTIFMRSPTYVFPRHDHPISSWVKTMIKYIPFGQKYYRAGMMDVRESFHRMIKEGEPFQDFVLKATEHKMKAELPDRPDLWKEFRPTFRPGCKRPIISDAWYPTFMRENVALETKSIHAITRTGISLETNREASLPFDVIICATGFESFNFLAPMEIRTQSGNSLRNSIWGRSPYSLRGISAPECPNFGMLFGPNSGLSHNSLVLVIEAQSRVVTRMITAVLQARRSGLTLALSPRYESLKRWNDEEQDQLSKTTYLDPSCTSWWKNADNRVTNQYHGTAVEYQKEMSYVRWSEYDFIGTAAANMAGKKDEYIGRVVEETCISMKMLGLGVPLATASVCIMLYLLRR